MYYYRQNINPSVYEEARKSLEFIYKREIEDHEVETHYNQLQQDAEKSHGIFSAKSFAEICEFSCRFQKYLVTWQPQQDTPCDSLGRRLYAILDMHKNGHCVPQILLDEANQYMAEQEGMKEFLLSLKGESKEMYKQYRSWLKENFATKKAMSLKEFRETLQMYRT